MPVNPNSAATNAITKNMTAQRNTSITSLLFGVIVREWRFACLRCNGVASTVHLKKLRGILEPQVTRRNFDRKNCPNSSALFRYRFLFLTQNSH
jgi:hypothetical protein